ncbi:DUF7937 domain-containing protein [Isoptericola cucumis]|uniref:Uncharacterized protein n=1 Tax=Isoptericola cucumis TaxID=1776856 RepID=A0ABQ2B2Y0_9MICO|nr:hypothetical protein [Isoptericola cucumis]GGI06507.1 hypothetical protein GCM10007368_11510 [Isoptericola cucumis]
MTDNATPDAPASPAVAGAAPREIARDVVAALALLVALPMPWDLTHRGSDRIEVVLVTVLTLVVLALPYVRRAGLGSPSWDALTTPRARLIGCAPYLLVTLVYLVLDAARPGAAEGAVGAGVVLGLAGAALALAPTWERTLLVVAGLVGLGALATPVASLIDGDPWSATVVGVLNAALVLGVLWLTAVSYARGDLVAGIVLLVVGAAVAIELILFAGGQEAPWFESVHAQRLGLLLLPVVAACAARRVLDDVAAVAGDPQDVHAARWVAVAVRCLDLVLLVAGFVALVALVRLVAGGVAVSLVLRLICGVLMVAVAFMARRALVRDPRSGHTTAVGAACALVVLGLVIVVARAGLGTQANVEELLVTFALPAATLAALLVPASVRELVASAPEPAPEDAGPGAPLGAATSEDAPRSTSEETPTGPMAVVQDGGQGWAQEQPQEQTQGWAQERASEQARPASWTAAAPQQTAPQRTPQPMDSTQQMEPVRDGSWGAAGAGAGGAAGVDSTQVLPPVPAEAAAPGWTAAHALDPGTPLADLARIVQEAPHLRAHVASNPSTYPALLDWLGALGDPAVDAALRSRR